MHLPNHHAEKLLLVGCQHLLIGKYIYIYFFFHFPITGGRLILQQEKDAPGHDGQKPNRLRYLRI